MHRFALVLSTAVAASLARGVSYEDLGVGLCIVGDQEPDSVELEPFSAPLCQLICTNMATCYGYVATASEKCIVYQEGPLLPTGEPHDGGSCQVKDPPPEPPPGSGDLFRDLGKGSCLYRGQMANGTYHVGLDEDKCLNLCAQDQGCHGYSWRNDIKQDNHSVPLCLTYKEGPLSGHGFAWGNGHCMVREHPAAKQEAATPPLRLRSAPPAAATWYLRGGPWPPGVCTADGKSPHAHFYSGLGAAACEGRCTASAACFGFSSAASGDCKLFTEGPLEGGGEAWDGATCAVKSPRPAPPASGASYQDAGDGECRALRSGAAAAPGPGPPRALLPRGVTAAACARLCTADDACTGYASQDDSCKLYRQAPLSGGGSAWGYARCQIKIRPGLLFP